MPREKITVLTPAIVDEFNKHYFPSPNDNGCFIWLGYTKPNNYGYLKVLENDKWVSYYAHRISYMIHNKIDKLFREKVLHRCPGKDNPSCVNPAHLYIGSQYENMKRMTELGNRIQGATHPTSKITDDDVREIRKDYRSGKFNQKELAEIYSISVSNVSMIVNYKAWTHVKG